MRQSAVSFKVKGLTFEGVLAQPDDAGTAMPGVVICHPHPLHGGSMDNNVVLSVSFTLAQQGFVALRFNFRGVGNSEGEHSKGELEQQEALAALKLLKAWPGVDQRRIGPFVTPSFCWGKTLCLPKPGRGNNRDPAQADR